MQTLPRLSTAAGLVLLALWITPLLLTAQDAKTGVIQAGPKEAGSTKAESGKSDKRGPAPSARRNEKSGASALVTMEAARDKLIGYTSVRAKLQETVTVGERRFRLQGTYLQGTDLKLRLEYDVEVGSTKAKLVEVCDGQILWTHHILGKEQRVSRRNVRQIITAATNAGSTPQNLLTAELGLGGLPGMLASIQKSMQLERQWEQDVGEHSFFVIEGGWKQAIRDRFLGAGAPDTQAMPAFVPDRVRVYFERDSLFPRRILYLKRDGSNVHHPMVTLDLTEVEWNGAVDENAFAFVPPENVPLDDSTRAFVSQFEKAPEGAAAGSNAPGGGSTAPAASPTGSPNAKPAGQ